jgi:predicted AlkP superfamily phosphohydrolase/phosphomutase
MSDDLQRLLLPIKWISAGDVTFARVAERLYRQERPDFFTVYLRGMDSMGHLYWDYMQPDSAEAWRINPLGSKLLKGAEPAYYRFVDRLIGPILALADSNTTILVVSDHGFKGGVGRGVEAHRLDGVLIMAGKHVGKGEITGATVFDVTPTVLALLGLPPAEDMHGKVLWSAFDASIPRDRYRRRIATYETGERRTAPGPIASPVDEQLKERLRSLGYID